MRILITGITGYIGSNAADYFAREGYDIYGISNDAKAEKGRIRKADITDTGQVRAAIRSIKPDIVLHAAAISSLKACEKDPKSAEKVNLFGTKNMVDALLAIKPETQFIFLSTDYVFDGKIGSRGEKDSPRPATVYGKTKLAAEREAARLKSHIVIRTSAVFGRGGSFYTYLSDSFRKGAAVEAYDDAYFTPTYIGFLLDSIRSLITRKFIGTAHVSGSERISRYEFALMLAEAMGKPSLAIPSHKPPGELLARDSSLDASSLCKITGMQSPSVQKCISYALGSLLPPYFTHSDARGSITGMTQGRKWEEMNFITSIRGSMRGGHYHKETKEGIFVVQGRINITMREVKTGKHWSFLAEKGDFFIIPTGVSHTFEMLEDSAWINMLSKAMAGKQKDMHRA